MRYLTRLAAAVSFAFLLAPVSTTAQNTNFGTAQIEKIYPRDGQSSVPPYTGSIAIWQQKVDQACPVSLRAQHGSDGTMLKVDKARPEGLAQRLHIILTSKNSRQIVEAHLRVRGASGKAQVSRTNLGQNSMDATRNVTVNLRPSAENEVTGDTWVRGMSAVLQVELSWVTFDDGSVQRFGAAQGCRFTPEHLMLIADR